MLAIERQGMRVTLATSASPQVALEADGQMRAERYPNGRASNVRADFLGDTLTIASNGNRADDFTAIFTTLDDGRRMLVTRRVFAEGLNRFIDVKSYYDRTDVTARFSFVNPNRNVSVRLNKIDDIAVRFRSETETAFTERANNSASAF